MGFGIFKSSSADSHTRTHFENRYIILSCLITQQCLLNLMCLLQEELLSGMETNKEEKIISKLWLYQITPECN